MVTFLSDSSSAVAAAINLSAGTQSPRSGIELKLLRLLLQRDENVADTAIAWIRSHIDIKGNEEADNLARLG